MSLEIDSLPTIKSLLSESFLVEKYQRGYKWDIEKVAQLLEDIQQFYYEERHLLFIVTISKIENKTYLELIDGQQRLTTIFLILKSISNLAYHISYRARERSRKFLEKINDNNEHNNYELSFSKSEYIENQDNIIEKLVSNLEKCYNLN